MDTPEVKPVEAEVPVAVEPTPAETKPVEADQHDKEWDEAAKELFPNAKPSETKEEEASEAKPAEEAPKEPADKPVDAPVTETPTVPQEPADPRAAHREATQEYETVKSEVKQTVFGHIPTDLKDADGDPINGVEDVMKLMNPDTGVAFTKEEASIWLLQARQDLQDKRAQVEEASHQIAQINLTVHEEANRINKQFAKELEANPDVKKQLWEEYSKTLRFSPDGKVIIEAPVSLAKFYTMALAPYAKMSQVQREAEEAKAKAAEIEKKQAQADRSDIFGGGKTDITDPEDKEWAQAAKEHYSN